MLVALEECHAVGGWRPWTISSSGSVGGGDREEQRGEPVASRCGEGSHGGREGKRAVVTEVDRCHEARGVGAQSRKQGC